MITRNQSDDIELASYGIAVLVLAISTIYQQYQEKLDIVDTTKATLLLAAATFVGYLKYKNARAARERNERLNERAQQIVQDVVLEILANNQDDRNEIENPRWVRHLNLKAEEIASKQEIIGCPSAA